MINLINNVYRSYKFRKKNGKGINKKITLKNEKYISLGKNCNIGENSYLLCYDNYLCQNFSPQLKIGDNFHATRQITIQCCNNIKIGNNVLAGSNVFIVDYNHGVYIPSGNIGYLSNRLEPQSVIIEDDVWIGQNVIILPGVTVGKGAIVGAGSIVTKNVLAYSVVAGNPAKIIKTL